MASIITSKIFLIIMILLLDSELGHGLECFVCHSRNEKECSDPFERNKTDTIKCERVREVGLGVVAAASALGGAPGHFTILAEPPHVCFKLALGHFVARGCSKPDMCQNYTETDCDTCDFNGCNRSALRKPLNAIIYIITSLLYSYLKFAFASLQ